MIIRKHFCLLPFMTDVNKKRKTKKCGKNKAHFKTNSDVYVHNEKNMFSNSTKSVSYTFSCSNIFYNTIFKKKEDI